MSNKKFAIYQGRDSYGMTGEILFGGEDGREILFVPHDKKVAAFQVSKHDIFNFAEMRRQKEDVKKWWEGVEKAEEGMFS